MEDETIRLECLRLAASVPDHYDGDIVEIARSFYRFISNTEAKPEPIKGGSVILFRVKQLAR